MRNYPLHSVVLALLAAALGNASANAQLATSLTAVDVGEPPVPGSTTTASPGAFTVAGSGEYKNSASDNFHFAYTNVTGDFDYQVRVESLEVQSQWSKAGLMARETTEETVTVDVGSRSIVMTAYPPPPSGGNTLILIRREQADTPTADDILGTTPTFPNTWLRLRRLGDTLVGYTGTNGLTWGVQGVHDTAGWADGPLSPTLLLGLAVASANNTATVAAQFKDFGPVPSGNPLTISVPLKSLTVNKGKTATFSVTVSGYDPYSAQWFRNGTPLEGGTTFSFGNTLSYTTPILALEDNDSSFSVVVSNRTSSVTSSNALLRVLDDNTAPVVTAAVTDGAEINVVFSEEVSRDSALNLNNYTLRGATGVVLADVALSSNDRVAVLALSEPVTSTNASLTVARVQDVVGNVRTQTVPLWPLLPPANIVASGYPADRETAFASVSDGLVDGGWQTPGDRDHRPQFAGLIYANVQTFAVVKVDLGEQTQYGGSFVETPHLYLLKRQADTDIAGPETDPANWEMVGAQLVSPNLFDANVDPNPSPASPIVFDLTGLSPSQRAGYGWAVGGVRGDDSGFIRISELRGYGQTGGVVQTAPTMSLAKGPANTLTISWPTSATGFILKSTSTLVSPTWTAVAEPTVVTGNTVTITVFASSGTRFYRLEQ